MLSLKKKENQETASLSPQIGSTLKRKPPSLLCPLTPTLNSFQCSHVLNSKSLPSSALNPVMSHQILNPGDLYNGVV